MVKALDRKLLRDLRHLAVQGAAIAVLVACGVAVFVGSVATYRALARSQARYYATNRFADVFAEARRVPEPVAARIAALPGVAEVETRVVAAATVVLPGGDGPATARVLSLPPEGARLNRPHVRAGRALAPGAADEVLVSEGFALANRLRPGDRLDATTGRLVLEVLARVNAEVGTTTVVITHNASIGGMADRVVWLSDGRIAREAHNARRLAPAELTW